MNDHERDQATREIARKSLKDCLSLLDSNQNPHTDWRKIAQIAKIAADHCSLEYDFLCCKPRNVE